MNAAVEAGLSQLMLLAGMAIIIGVLLMRWHRRSSRQANDFPAAGRTVGRRLQASCSASAPAELGRWEVRMHDLARDLSGQLDSKMGVLAQLVQEADRAASRLEAAIAAAAGEPAGPPAAEAAALGSPRNPTDAAAADQAQKLKGGMPAGPGSPPASDPRSDPLLHRRRQQCCEEIYTLSDYGLEPSEIAQKVAIPVGEVELILGLRHT